MNYRIKPRGGSALATAERLLNTRMGNSGKIIIQYEDPAPMEHQNRCRYMVSRNAGETPDVEITVHGGEKNRETFDALIMAMRKWRYRQRNNGSEVAEYRVRLLD